MSSQIIGGEKLHKFEGTFRGTVIRPDDTDYDGARTVWNG